MARTRARGLVRGIDPRAGQQRVRTLLEHGSCLAAPLYRRTPTASTRTWNGSSRRACSRCRSHRSAIVRSPAASSTGSAAASPNELRCGTGPACRHSSAGARGSGTSSSTPSPEFECPASRPFGPRCPPSPRKDSRRPWHETNTRLADVLLVLGWTGLRWSEARAVRVEDLTRVPTPGLLTRRAAPEGVGLKSTKGRRSRRVPLADRVLPLVLDMAENKQAGRPPLHHHRWRPAPPNRSASSRELGRDQSRTPHPRPSPHRGLPLAGPRGGPGDRAGVDGSRVDRDHEPVPALLGTSAHRSGLERLNLPRGAAGGTSAPSLRELQP
jgi:hypothetical protein